jgi:hypothetical protein
MPDYARFFDSRGRRTKYCRPRKSQFPEDDVDDDDVDDVLESSGDCEPDIDANPISTSAAGSGAAAAGDVRERDASATAGVRARNASTHASAAVPAGDSGARARGASGLALAGALEISNPRKRRTTSNAASSRRSRAGRLGYRRPATGMRAPAASWRTAEPSQDLGGPNPSNGMSSCPVCTSIKPQAEIFNAQQQIKSRHVEDVQCRGANYTARDMADAAETYKTRVELRSAAESLLPPSQQRRAVPVAGQRVVVWFEPEDEWFPGAVENVTAGSGVHILFDDGDRVEYRVGEFDRNTGELWKPEQQQRNVRRKR